MGEKGPALPTRGVDRMGASTNAASCIENQGYHPLFLLDLEQVTKALDEIQQAVVNGSTVYERWVCVTWWNRVNCESGR